MKTSQPDVYAAGDIAAFPLKRSGGSLTRMEHVSHARLSAAVAMAEMLKPGSTHEYDYLPYFYSRIFDLHWEVRLSSQSAQSSDSVMLIVAAICSAS